jgi:hypothetical protein
MCGVVKPLRVECGPMHCRLPGQAISEAHQHSPVCQVGGRVGAGHRPPARGLRHTFSPADQGDHPQADGQPAGRAHPAQSNDIMPANSAADFATERFSIRFTRDAAKASQLWNAYIAGIWIFSWCASATARARAFRHGCLKRPRPILRWGLVPTSRSKSCAAYARK